MGFAIHTIDVPDTLPTAFPDRIVIGSGKAAVSAGAAGATVTAVVSGLHLPPSYEVLLQPNQAAFAWVTNKTAAGFTINLEPTGSGTIIAAGSVDFFITA